MNKERKDCQNHCNRYILFPYSIPDPSPDSLNRSDLVNQPAELFQLCISSNCGGILAVHYFMCDVIVGACFQLHA